MNQARRTQKPSSRRNFNNHRIGHGLKEILFIFFCFVSLYLLVSLFTYNPSDPGIFFGGQVDEVQNKGGIAGAFFADIFYHFFGYFAYLFPIIVGYVGWLIYQEKHHALLAEPKHLIIPGIGFVLTLSAGCGFAMVHFSAGGMLLPTHAGGALGILVGKGLQDIFDQLGATLVLLGLFLTGITLLTELSWLKLMDVLGFYTLKWTPVIQQFMLRNFWPWILYISKRSVEKTQDYSRAAYVRARRGGRAAWQAWQDRRAKWGEERERYEKEYYYDDEDDYDYDDDQYDDEQTKSTSKFAPVDEVNPIARKPQYYGEEEEEEENLTPAPVLPLVDRVFQLPNPNLLHAGLARPQQTVAYLSRWLTEGFAAIKMDIKIKEIIPGPVLTNFEVESITQINKMHLDDMAVALGEALNSLQTKIVETMPGILAVEVANLKRQTITLREALEDVNFSQSSSLNLLLGKSISGEVITLDLARMPHVLVAGSDDDEKNMILDMLLLSALYKSSPEELRLVIVDNAINDFADYANLPHLLTPIVQDMDLVAQILQWCVHEMERRYRIMGECGVRNIESYNQALLNGDDILYIDHSGSEKPQLFPYIMIFISEIAQLMKTNVSLAAESSITLLTQKSRAAGIHLILATDEPNVNVITGLIKANIPTRLALKVHTKSESRAILGQMGAENLLGQGDMLYISVGSGTMRIHGCQVSQDDRIKTLNHLTAQAQAGDFTPYFAPTDFISGKK